MNTVLNNQQFSRAEINSAALEAFFNITELWKLTTTQKQILLGLDSNSSTYFKWQKEKSGILSKDHLDRISYVLGIYKALKIIFTNDDQAHAWIKKPNIALNSQSALDVMLQGKITDLAIVRGYLDAQRSW